MGIPGREFAPAGEVLLLCFAKEKYPKERRAEVVAPFAALRGTLRCSVWSGSRSNSAYGLKQSRALIRPALRYSPTPHGVGADSQTTNSQYPARRSRAATASRPRRDVARSATDPDPRGPPLYAPRSTALGGSGLALSERSEFSQTPHKARTAGSRSASRGRRQWGRLSFGDFSFAQKNKLLARRGELPAGDRIDVRRHSHYPQPQIDLQIKTSSSANSTCASSYEK